MGHLSRVLAGEIEGLVVAAIRNRRAGIVTGRRDSRPVQAAQVANRIPPSARSLDRRPYPALM